MIVTNDATFAYTGLSTRYHTITGCFGDLHCPTILPVLSVLKIRRKSTSDLSTYMEAGAYIFSSRFETPNKVD
jgi:hypothetical protein